jgi:acyl dehydratase
VEPGAALAEPLAELPAYRVRARNLSRYSANRIHDDAVARAHGYAGALVAGTTLYAYLTQPLVAAWGAGWLERGVAQVRLLRPVYEGEDVRVAARVAGRSGDAAAGEVALDVQVTTAPGAAPAAAAVAGIAWGGPPVVPGLARYPARPLPSPPPAAATAALAALDPLGSPALELPEAEARRYADEVEGPLPLYRGPGALAHPGLLLQQANRALSENVVLGPWVHVASDVAHCGLARAGDRLATRGRVVRVYERKGHRYVELDVLVVADEARPVLHVRHTAIWELAAGPRA